MQPCVGVACPRSVAVGMFEKAQASQERTSRLLYKPSPGPGWALSGGSPVSAPGFQPTGQRPSHARHLTGLRGCLSALSRETHASGLELEVRGVVWDRGRVRRLGPAHMTSPQVLPISGSRAHGRPAPSRLRALRSGGAVGGGGGRAGPRGGKTIERPRPSCLGRG